MKYKNYGTIIMRKQSTSTPSKEKFISEGKIVTPKFQNKIGQTRKLDSIFCLDIGVHFTLMLKLTLCVFAPLRLIFSGV